MEYFLTQLGISVFAISGVLSAARTRLDLVSVIIVGLLTALGGGTLRDIILDLPVFWLLDLTYFWVAMGASCLTFVGIPLILKLPLRLISYLDAAGIALISVQVSLANFYSTAIDAGNQTKVLNVFPISRIGISYGESGFPKC